MSAKDKHPHMEKPSIEQLEHILQDKGSVVRRLYLNTHQLILETLPDVAYSVDCQDGQMGYGARQYGYDGWGMAALSAHQKWVSLFFMCGIDLDNRQGMLEGGGKNMRHVKLRTPKQFEERRGELIGLIQAASKLNA
jgi:hypothetical protein